MKDRGLDGIADNVRARLNIKLSRLDVSIEATADALLSVCAVQTGEDPDAALLRATAALETVWRRAEQEQRG